MGEGSDERHLIMCEPLCPPTSMVMAFAMQYAYQNINFLAFHLE
jgi:hypothetical protein